jgi:hypothetical protein
MNASKQNKKKQSGKLLDSTVPNLKQGPENYFLDSVNNYVVMYRPPKPSEYSSEPVSFKC